MASEEIRGIIREIVALRRLVESLSPKPPGDGCEVDNDVRIDPSCRFTCNPNSPIRIGEHTQVWRGAEWLGPITVGKRVFVNQGSYIRSSVTIEDDVSLGPFVRLISDSHDIGKNQRRTGNPRVDPILIGRGTWVGAGAMVLGGVTIGARSIIAAGSVVTRDVPDNVVVGGMPARIIKHISDGAEVAKLMPIQTTPSPIRLNRRRSIAPRHIAKLRGRNEC